MSSVQQIVETHLDILLSNPNLGEEYYLSDKEGGWHEGKDYGFIRDRIPYYKDPIKRQKIIDRFNEIEIRDNKLVLYRGYSYNGDFKLDRIGTSWTFNIKKAYCYRGLKSGTNDWYRYHALVPTDSVNWFLTIQKGMVFHAHEKEVIVNQGAPLTVFKVERLTKTICDLLNTYDVVFESKG